MMVDRIPARAGDGRTKAGAGAPSRAVRLSITEGSATVGAVVEAGTVDQDPVDIAENVSGAGRRILDLGPRGDSGILKHERSPPANTPGENGLTVAYKQHFRLVGITESKN